MKRTGRYNRLVIALSAGLLANCGGSSSGSSDNNQPLSVTTGCEELFGTPCDTTDWFVTQWQSDLSSEKTTYYFTDDQELTLDPADASEPVHLSIGISRTDSKGDQYTFVSTILNAPNNTKYVPAIDSNHIDNSKSSNNCKTFILTVNNISGDHNKDYQIDISTIEKPTNISFEPTEPDDTDSSRDFKITYCGPESTTLLISQYSPSAHATIDTSLIEDGDHEAVTLALDPLVSISADNSFEYTLAHSRIGLQNQLSTHEEDEIFNSPQGATTSSLPIIPDNLTPEWKHEYAYSAHHDFECPYTNDSCRYDLTQIHFDSSYTDINLTQSNISIEALEWSSETRELRLSFNGPTPSKAYFSEYFFSFQQGVIDSLRHEIQFDPSEGILVLPKLPNHLQALVDSKELFYATESLWLIEDSRMPSMSYEDKILFEHSLSGKQETASSSTSYSQISLLIRLR